MRSRFVLLAISILLVCGSGTAHAYAIQYSTSPLGSLTTSDTVTVDLYLDADPGLQLLSIGVLWETSRLEFQPLASSSASYILYTPTPPPGQAGEVDRLRDPWVEWPGTKPPGFSQVNIDYTTPFSSVEGFLPAAESGTNIWLTSLVFHVLDGSGAPPIIDVTITAAGNVIYANDAEIDPADVPITLIPEPATGLLVAMGLLVSVLGGARRFH